MAVRLTAEFFVMSAISTLLREMENARRKIKDAIAAAQAETCQIGTSISIPRPARQPTIGLLKGLNI